MELAAKSDEVAYSAAGKRWNTQISRGIGGWVVAPNHSEGYHGLLQQWWEAYGLGCSSVLVSETREVGAVFQKLYPKTRMVTTDYFLDLNSQHAQTDVLWNLYEPIPSDLAATQFGSVVCQATLEHLVDPVGVLRKLIGLLADGGHLYMHTHTPLFPYHGWPKDYSRFFPEWFRDIGLVIPEIEVIEVYCKAGHAFAAYRKRVVSAVQRS
jgi:SAM-dependent methyltransferase